MTDFQEPFAHAPRPHTLDLTDDELLILISAGTTGAFATFYARHASDVQIHVAERFDSFTQHQAQQVAVSAFLFVLKTLLAGTERIAAGDVLHRVGRVADEVAADEDFSEVGRSDVVTDESWIHLIGQVGSSQNLAEVFASLPDHWQRILWLKHVEGLSVARVAEQLGSDTRRVDRLARRAVREFSRRQSSRVGDGGRRYPGGESFAEQTPSTSSLGSADALRGRPGTGLADIVLSSPALLEQHVDLIARVPMYGRSAGPNIVAAPTNPFDKEKLARGERVEHAIRTHRVRLDSARVGRTRKRVSGPALVAVSFAGVALCACAIGLILSPSDISESPMSPAGTPLGEPSSSSGTSHTLKPGAGTNPKSGDKSAAALDDSKTTNQQEPEEKRASEEDRKGTASIPPKDASTPPRSHPDEPVSTATSDPSDPASTSPADPDPTVSDGPTPSASESPTPSEAPSPPTQDPEPTDSTDPPDDTDNPESSSAGANGGDNEQ